MKKIFEYLDMNAVKKLKNIEDLYLQNYKTLAKRISECRIDLNENKDILLTKTIGASWVKNTKDNRNNAFNIYYYNICEYNVYEKTRYVRQNTLALDIALVAFNLDKIKEQDINIFNDRDNFIVKDTMQHISNILNCIECETCDIYPIANMDKNWLIPFYVDLLCSKYLSEKGYDKRLANLYPLMNNRYKQVFDSFNRFYNAFYYIIMKYSELTEYCYLNALKKFIDDLSILFIDGKSIEDYNLFSDNILDEVSKVIYEQLIIKDNAIFIDMPSTAILANALLYNYKKLKLSDLKYSELYEYVISTFKSGINKRRE